MRFRNRNRAAMLLGASAFTMASAHAFAQSASPGSDEVVVTAEKRETTVQKAPVAITAVSANVLAEDNIVKVTQLNGQVPGLTVSTAGPVTPVIAIRGVGFETSDNITAEPGVSYHVDGVYIAYPIDSTVEFLDTQRVEVLRGPQSTVFGQSATGGAINVISYRPVLNHYSGDLEDTYGTYDERKADGVINLPIGDQAAFRFAASRTLRDGFAVETGLPDYKLDDANTVSLKAELLWQPRDDFSIELTGQKYTSKNHGPAMKWIDDPNPNPREITEDFPNKFKLNYSLYTADMEWKLPLFTVKSITAYQEAADTDFIDNDRSTYAVSGFYDNVEDFDQRHSWTEEVDLSSNTGGWADWLAGVFYLHEWIGGPGWFEWYGYDADPTFTIPTSAANLPYNFSYSSLASDNRDSYAVFGQSTFHIRPWLRLIGGLRYTYETLNQANSTDFAPVGHVSTSVGELTGKAEIQADIDPNHMVYGEWSRGFKPGGVNLNYQPMLVPVVFKPETISAFEAGSKNRFFDNRLVLNAAGFFYDYQDFQYQEEDPIPYEGGVSNIPKAQVYGVEAEATWKLTDTATITASATREHGTFIGNYSAIDPAAAAVVRNDYTYMGYSWYDPATIAAVAASARNTNGNQVPKIPDWQGNIAIQDSWRLGPGVLDGRLEWVYRGQFIYRVFNESALDSVPSYNVFNANVDYKLKAMPVTLSITATNLFDVAGVDGQYTNPFGVESTERQYIPPRQVLGTIRYAF